MDTDDNQKMEAGGILKKGCRLFGEMTSSTSNDSPVDNVSSDTRDFDHDVYRKSSDQAALMNKIMDMRVDFHRRIIEIEQYLKISTSSNAEKPSYGSDNHDNHVKLRDTESICVDRDVKHLDLWVLYLWHFRSEKADWVIARSFFNTFMLRNELSCCYANDVTYGVP
nr:phospholipase-like protein [Tanacetum cinerariifolium]